VGKIQNTTVFVQQVQQNKVLEAFKFRNWYWCKHTHMAQLIPVIRSSLCLKSISDTIPRYSWSPSTRSHEGNGWRGIVSFTPRLLYSRGKSLRYPLNERLGGSQSRCDHYGEKKNIFPCRESKDDSSVVHHANEVTTRINPLKTKRSLLYIKTLCVPRSKHFQHRLWKANELLMLTVKVAVFSDICTKHINAIWALWRIIEYWTWWYVKLRLGFKRLTDPKIFEEKQGPISVTFRNVRRRPQQNESEHYTSRGHNISWQTSWVTHSYDCLGRR
jgi:hypothetical protein